MPAPAIPPEDEELRNSRIQRFEPNYEPVCKMRKRRLKMSLTNPQEIVTNANPISS